MNTTSAQNNGSGDQKNDNRHLIEAEVAPDLDQVIDEAVQNALKNREATMYHAAPVEDDIEGQQKLQDQLAQLLNTVVPLGQDPENEEAQRKRKRKLLNLFGAIGFVIVIVITVLAITLSGGSDDGGGNNSSPLEAPPSQDQNDDSIANTESPTEAGPEWTIPPTISNAFPSTVCRQDSTIILPFSREETNHSAPLSNFANSECQMDAGATIGNLLWYTLAPYKNEIVTASLRAQSMFSFMYVLEGDCDATMTCLGRGANSYANLAITFPAMVGKTYFIAVATNNGNGGKYQLDIENKELVANNECSGAVEIDSNSFSETMSNEAAFPGFSDVTCRVNTDDRGVWFHYKPQAEDSIVTASVIGQQFNAKLSYYTVGDDCGSLKCEEGTPAFQWGDRSITFHAQMGIDYYLLVAGNGFQEAGAFQFEVEAPKPPTNSYCSGAADVSDEMPFVVIGSTEDAVPAFSSLLCDVDPTSRGLWYKFLPREEDVIVTVTLSDQTSRSRLSYYSGDSCENLACEGKTASATSTQSIAFHAEVDKTYYFLVSGHTFANAGLFRISIDGPEPPRNSVCNGAQSVLTGSETSVILEDSSLIAVPAFSSLICGVTDTARGLWYKYIAATESVATVRLFGQQFDSSLSYYTGACGSLKCEQSTTASRWNDRTISFRASAGMEYFFLVSGKNFDDAGAFSIQIDAPLPPANSYCSGAKNTLTGMETIFSIEESNAMAVPSFSSLLCNIDSTHQGLWYRVSPPTDSTVSVDVSGQEASSRISLYTGSCDTLNCEKESGASTRERSLLFHGIAGNDYYVLVSGFAFGSVGNFRLEIYAPRPPASSFCAGAIEVPSSAVMSGGISLAGDSNEAVPSHTSLVCSLTDSSRGIWYKLAVADQLFSEVTATLGERTFSTKMTLFSTTSSTSCDELNCVSRTSANQYSARTLTWSASLGDTYYMLVSGSTIDDAGEYVISFSPAET